MPGKYQSTPYSCGPAALQCALACLGINAGQGRLAGLAGTTEDGTDEVQLMTAIDALGLRPDVLHTSSRMDARAWLHERAAFHPSILCVDNWDHWVTLAGQCGDRFFVHDPSRIDWNKASRGSWALKENTLLRRWKASRAKKGKLGAYYAIGVLRR